ncbi:uncharacterized protein B0T15DRAFT_510373 [Chaetomium strumarium]|uniref:Sm domain-containing protein n=1 Tax=Chaetomium strumarium TaxID=1170767 RepID=A0AAJ0GVT2_9PEZI|nr:hypothetical protein B0T15DRAFT_510373 [Chaetomium strumarium]
MLPLGLLNAAQGQPMLVELKNGETLNGHLVLCDTWMNLTMREVVQTSPEGDKFVRLPEVYVKGNNIKASKVAIAEDVVGKGEETTVVEVEIGPAGEEEGEAEGAGELGTSGFTSKTTRGLRRVEAMERWRRYESVVSSGLFMEHELRYHVVKEWLGNDIHARRVIRINMVFGDNVSTTVGGPLPSVFCQQNLTLSPYSMCAITNHTAAFKYWVLGNVRQSPRPKPQQRVTPFVLRQPTSGTTPAIYEVLRLLRGQPGQAAELRHLVKYLIEERGERPNVFLYEALLVANWDTTSGSAAELREMLLEMSEAGIESSPGFYHSALQLLAIHPDYLLRNTILQDMKKNGVELSDEGKCSVALGLLRDMQDEMALEYWDQMHRDGTNIPNWVFEIFVYVLGMRGYVDEAFRLFRRVQEGANDSLKAAPLRVWFYLLDECSRNFHHEGTTFIWEKMVEPGTLSPPDGICLNVLNTASRHGDSRLATAVIQVLSERRVKLGLHHYEALLESYVHDGQLEKAFRVLCIMTGAGVRPDQSSTRSIFLMLKRASERAKQVVGILQKLRKEHELPVAAINVLLEALAETTTIEETLDMYRQVCDLCQSGPNRETFTLLLQRCSTAEPAVFLVSEMDRFSVRPSSTIVDNLIRCFAYDGNLDIALLYLSGMQRSDSPMWVSRRTLLTVLQRCYKEKDPRVWSVVDEAKKRGVTIEKKVMDRLNEILPVAGESG